MDRSLLYNEIDLLRRNNEVDKLSEILIPKTIDISNTDLDAPYFGGNFDFLYNGGSNEAMVSFNTYISYRKKYSDAAKKDFIDRLKQAMNVWDCAAELQIKDTLGNYDTKIKLRFQLRIVEDANNASKKTDVHPNGSWSSWFNGASREIVMRDFNVFIGSSRNVLVHELGHVWGLVDEYDTALYEELFSPAHVGSDSPLLKDEKAIMNLGYQDEISNSGEFRARYFTHFARKLLGSFWGIKKYMFYQKINDKIVATAIVGRIKLLKRDIQSNPPFEKNAEPFNPVYQIISIPKRGKVALRKK
jgi:hypothetical protein